MNERDRRNGEMILAAIKGVKGRRTRHQVTADRLRDTLMDFPETTDGELRDEVSRVIDWLESLDEPASQLGEGE